MTAPPEHSSALMKSPKSHLTVVIKLGTSSIVDEKTHEPLLPVLTLIVATAVKLRKDGHKVVIVSSGAIGVGLQRMDQDKRPKHLAKLQAMAAIGQCRLMSLWDNFFGHYRQPIAQILLTRNDIADRTRYLNAQNTMTELLDMGVIPIVNENDTLAVAEIKFGDNDTLSAITAAMVHADFLFLMTDVDCLYDKNPRTHPDAKPIEVVEDISSVQADVSSAGSSLGTGGMGTKIVAAKLATSAGVTTVITRSSSPNNISQIVHYVQSLNGSKSSRAGSVDGHPHDEAPTTSSSPGPGERDKVPLHTRFLPLPQAIRDRYFWLLHGLAPHGTLFIDAGAHRALADKAGLLPVGILDVEGHFASHEAVRVVVVERASGPEATAPATAADGTTAHRAWRGTPVEVGRALVNYAASEIMRIKGRKSTQIEGLLGYADSAYVADRDNVSLFARESRPVTPTLEASMAATAAAHEIEQKA